MAAIDSGVRRGLSPLAATAIGGVAAAIVEITPSLIVQAKLGVSPPRLFQSIASGLQGRAAYDGGMASALLGVAIHLLISFVAAGLYVAARRRFEVLARWWLPAGLAYGVACYGVMNYAVTPLSAIAFAPATDPRMIALSLGVHMLFFGLPIAWVARYAR